MFFQILSTVIVIRFFHKVTLPLKAHVISGGEGVCVKHALNKKYVC